MSKIRLRRLLDADFNNVLDLVQDADVMQYLGDQRPLTDNEAKVWFNEEINLPTRFAVSLGEEDEFIGICGIKSKGNINDFSCFIRRKYWKHGYASQACEAFISMSNMIPEIQQMEIFIASDNIASQRLAMKLGYRALSPAQSDRGPGHLYTLDNVKEQA